ncbi:MAG: hypothetical protein AAGJ83_05375, partial [Planctomycetota bacterium]
SPQAEGLAFQKLDAPITDRATIRMKFRSVQKSGVTRNGALVIATKPTNAASFKVGTAIGMNQHVAFEGGWANVGNAGKKKASFASDATFEVSITVDLSTRKGTAEINGTHLKFVLPPGLSAIEYVGIYAKATATEFSLPMVE